MSTSHEIAAPSRDSEKEAYKLEALAGSLGAFKRFTLYKEYNLLLLHNDLVTLGTESPPSRHLVGSI